jgi:hypothetical protein
MQANPFLGVFFHNFTKGILAPGAASGAGS